MPDYDNTNKGAIFKAKEKRTERSPDRTGEITVQCPHCNVVSEFWLSGWLKRAKTSGMIFLSLAVNAKEEQEPASNLEKELEDDDVPF